MIAGRESWPAVARSVSPHAATRTAATLDRTATRAPPRGRLVSRPSSLSSPYALTRRGKPACQNIYSQAVLWGPAPSRPVGENRPRSEERRGGKEGRYRR